MPCPKDGTLATISRTLNIKSKFVGFPHDEENLIPICAFIIVFPSSRMAKKVFHSFSAPLLLLLFLGNRVTDGSLPNISGEKKTTSSVSQIFKKAIRLFELKCNKESHLILLIPLSVSGKARVCRMAENYA